jgi:hypothetical protein
MQIHTHKLPSRVGFQQGDSFVVKREQSQHPPGTHEERRPRSFIASGSVLPADAGDPDQFDAAIDDPECSPQTRG